jgi:O-antigen/teichoic acid export membrane protein
MDTVTSVEGQQPATPPTRALGQIILRNALAVFTGGLAIKGLNFLFTIFMVRLLGEVGLGKFAVVTAFVGLFGVFFELGLAQYVERSVAQDRTRTQALFWNLVALRLILAVLGVAIITGLAVVWGHEPEIVLGICLFSLTFILAAVLMPLMTVLSANERFDLVTLGQIINQIVSIVAGAILLLMGMGFLALVYAGFVAMPLQIVMCIWAIRRYRLGPLPFRVTPNTWGSFIRASLPFGLTSLALTFNFNADTVILEMFRDVSEVGWYNAGYRLVFTLVNVAGAFLTVMTPSIAREYVNDPAHVRAWTRSSIRAMALPALPIAVGASLLSTPIVVLLYGKSLAPAGEVLAIISWDIPLLLFTAFCGNVAAAVGLERPASRIYLTSTTLNIVLNLLFIPFFGKIAAAVITLVTDGLTMGLFYLLLRQHMELAELTPVLLRTALAAALMGVVVWLVQALGLPVLVVIAIGAVAYAMLALMLRLVDISVVLQTLRRFMLHSREA